MKKMNLSINFLVRLMTRVKDKHSKVNATSVDVKATWPKTADQRKTQIQRMIMMV